MRAKPGAMNQQLRDPDNFYESGVSCDLSELRYVGNLRLFTTPGQRAMAASELATACRASERGIRILCHYLTVIGLLNKSPEQYSLTPTAAAFLDENSAGYMGSVARFIASGEVMDTYRDVAGAVRRGGTLLPDGGSTKVNYEPWIEFAESMGPMMRPVAIFFDFSGIYSK